MGYNVNDIFPIINDKSGKFFDFALKTGHPIITDYSQIDREIVIKDDIVMLGDYKKKIKISSTSELERTFRDLFMMIYEAKCRIESYIFSKFNPDYKHNEQLPWRLVESEHNEMFKLLAYQLIFDVLYKKYINDSPQLTLNKYCENYIDYNWDNSIVVSSIANLLPANNDKPALKKIAEKKANELSNIPDTYIEYIELALAKINYDFNKKSSKKPNFIEILRSSIEFIHVHKKEFAELKTLEQIEKLAVTKKIKVSVKELAIVEAIMEDAEKLGFEPEKYLNSILQELLKAKNRSTKAMRAEIVKEVDIKNNPRMKEDIEKFGVNSAKYLERAGTVNDFYKIDKSRYKHEWDYVYYNHFQITARQYDRNFGIDRVKRSYYYGHFVRDFDAYDRFVERLLPKDSDNGYEYFRKSMDFYHLERYKRLDYIYKLTVKMESIGLTDIDREHFLIKRFHPCVFRPLMDNKNNCPCYAHKRKYYLPLLFIEESWLKKEKLDNPSLFLEYHLLRAKAYELFEYHFDFDSEDYNDMEKFIRVHYNLSNYHTPKKEWYNPEKRPRDQTLRIQNADSINKSLFWDSDKRIPKKWEYPNKE